jgi:hypothetical protein
VITLKEWCISSILEQHGQNRICGNSQTNYTYDATYHTFMFIMESMQRGNFSSSSNVIGLRCLAKKTMIIFPILAFLGVKDAKIKKSMHLVTKNSSKGN